MTRALVVCIGNALAADDAVGPRVHAELLGRTLPEHVALKLLGLGGIALLDELGGEETLVVVDAVRFGAAPGTLHVVDGAALGEACGMPVTSHDIGLGEVLAVGTRLFPERMPKKILLVGIEGACFDQLGAPLTREVEAALPAAVEAVLQSVGT
jgi:hydrogenase maturation protease